MNLQLELATVHVNPPYCGFRATILNHSEHPITDWICCFSICRLINPATVQSGKIEQIGSFCRFTPNGNPTLTAGGTFSFEFELGTAPLHYSSDGFGDAYLELTKIDNKRDDNATTKIRYPIHIGVFDLALTAAPLADSLPTVSAKQGIIPVPQHCAWGESTFMLGEMSAIGQSDTLAEIAMQWLQEEASARCGLPLPKKTEGQIVFLRDTTLPDAAYTLVIDTSGITLSANSVVGFIHATASLLQCIPAMPAHSKQNVYPIHAVEIHDKPRFAYRGMMLDCGRHFHTISTIKRLINQLAYYKFNTFHWHLTDDEGWRIEIKAYPELTHVGAWRGPDEVIAPQYTQLSTRHGGFYTQAEIRDVIAYAQARGIMIIPEIDIPGHCRAAILALPELLRDPTDHSQYRSIQYYNDNILSPALQSTYTFLDTVFAEVCALFPAPYVHIGADEVPEGVWTDSPACLAMMQQHNYQSPKELQGHLLRYVEQQLKAHGKRMMGWEEATDGNKVSKQTIIFSWRGEAAGAECITQGYDVIMQPAPYTYLDFAQSKDPSEPGVDWAGNLNLEQAYHYEPLSDLPSDSPLREHVLGLQAALWCEQINNQNRIDYMLYPRLLALSEAAWSQKHIRNWHDFLQRLQAHRPLLDRHGINYRQF